MDQESGEPKEVARLVITLFDNQAVKVEGPIKNKQMSYGMLEVARDAIFEQHFMDRLKPKNGNGILSFVRGR